MKPHDDVLEIARILLSVDEFRHLGEAALLHIANDAQFATVAKGKTLPADQYLQRRLYLLEGEVELIADNKVMQYLAATSEHALLPVFRIHTHGLYARALTRARLLSLNEAVVEKYVATIRPRESEGIAVEEYASLAQGQSIIEEIRHSFHHHEVDLPSLPEVALRVNAGIKQADHDIRKLAMEIQADPMIAARVIQVANSALYRSARPLDSVQDAISRIGVRALQVILMSVVLRNLFKPKTRLIHERARAFYAYSIRVGAVSHILARHLHGFDPEHAFLAGLLHAIGVMPILIVADERAELANDPHLLERVIQELCGTVGELLLQQWDFAGDLQTIAREAQAWYRETDKADYCDLIQIAQLHCHLVGGKKIAAPSMTELPAFRRLQLASIDPVSVIQEARDEVHEIVNLLLH